uniref:DSBA-like thioredoxin domain-containing protein n=1 Tax=Eucampia antarctica TaxID=49252 RepID=A0A7S2W0N6_9STRA|mmetsp:Transcript_16667/g.16098  ORF Transcript_16667/g.16098 Transcript_16667/m.16098 type:complete len:139 (+) Transcript_16667:178-594(+)
MIPSMEQVAKKDGINMSYAGNIGNTFDSHRLIWKAHADGGSELQDRIVEELFKAYFENEKSLGDHDVLKECAEKAGMDATPLLNDQSMGQEETLAEMEEFRTKYRCSGVPFFVFDGKYDLSGAQPPEEIVSVLERLLD